MTKEIKEILDRLQDSVNYPKIDMPTFDGSDFDYIDNDTLLEPSKCKLLLNYITNLQKEKEKLKDELYSTNQVVNELLDIQSRNEKAVEYLKYQISNLDFEKDIKAKMLGAMAIVILQGGDE